MPPKKKPPPPKPTEGIPLVTTETYEERLTRTILTMQRVMEITFSSESTVGPQNLIDATHMYICQMHLKKVTEEFFIEHMTTAFRMLELAMQIRSEGTLLRVEGLHEDAKKIVMGAIEVSVQEISSLRDKMMVDVKALGEIPLPGAQTH